MEPINVLWNDPNRLRGLGAPKSLQGGGNQGALKCLRFSLVGAEFGGGDVNDVISFEFLVNQIKIFDWCVLNEEGQYFPISWIIQVDVVDVERGIGIFHLLL